jgi:molybdate transport system substrate-binding protein
MLGRFGILPAVALSSLLVAGCGSVPAAAPTTDPRPRASRPAGPLTVFAAASLTESFAELQAALARSDPDLSLRYSFAGSGALVAQIRQGAPADVVATADTVSMKVLVEAGLVEQPTAFATNRLEILVAPRNPKGVRALPDLSRPDLKVVLADDEVPAGRYSAQALRAAAVTVRPVSREVDVKAAVSKVTTGEADATIVYASDVQAAGTRGQGVTIPDRLNVVAEFPIAVVKATGNRAAAQAFVDAVADERGQGPLRRHGFLPPT